MAFPFSAIGFDINSPEELLEVANQVGPKSEGIKVTDGSYFYWHDLSGAELWIQLNQDNSLIGVNPHFAGQSQVKVGITQEIRRPYQTLLDGAIYGWANASDDEPESGDFPFVFDLPNYQQFNWEFPSLVLAQITAFAHDIEVYASVEAYNEQTNEKRQFASQSFIPSGLFSPGGESTEPPQAQAIITGHIVKFEEKVNGLTNRKFYWASVDTFGGNFDVVIDPALISTTPKEGGVLSGSFWLSGTINK